MKSKAIARLIITVIVVVNMILTAKGIDPIPFDETAITEAISYVLGGLGVVWAWWKNNPIRNHAIKAQKDLEAYKVITEDEDKSIL